MAQSLSVVQAQKALRKSAKGAQWANKEILSLDEAKQKLRHLDEVLDLPPLVSTIEKGELKKASLIALAWSVSSAGLKVTLPLVRYFLVKRL